MIPERNLFYHVFLYMIPTLLSKANEVIFLAIREQEGQKHARLQTSCSVGKQVFPTL